MAACIFMLKDIIELAAFNLTHNQGASFDDLYADDLYPGGKVILKDGWPDSDKIDQNKLNAKRALHLVGDHGLYMMAGSKENFPRKDGGEGSHVVYAKGCNPDLDEDFYDNKKALFGGDDGVLSIPLAWVEIARKLAKAKGVPEDKAKFIINLNSKSFSLSKTIK